MPGQLGEQFEVKLGFAGLGTISAYYANNIDPLVWMLVIFSISDLITGTVAAACHGRINSHKASRGFVKKVFYFVLVGVGFGVDFIVLYMAEEAGFLLHHAPFGILCVCYLLATEALSILENLAELDITVPFLNKFLKAFRERISEKGGKE